MTNAAWFADLWLTRRMGDLLMRQLLPESFSPNDRDKPMKHMGRTNRTLTLSFCCLSLITVSAQDPGSVDIMLAPGGSATRLDVRVRANGSFFNGIVSGLYFTIRWPATSTASLGSDADACSLAANIFPTAEVTNGGFKYRTYNCQSSQTLASAGCFWPGDSWYTVTAITVVNPGQCTSFSIVNDAFTAVTNRDFYCQLSGVQKTGAIVANSVTLCTVDCLGVTNGDAQQGTPCNDGDACTVNEVWGPGCLCTGTSSDSDVDGICDALDLCPDVPGQPGSACDDGNAGTYNDVLNGNCGCTGTVGAQLLAKVYLEGPYVTADGRMQDYLRDAALLPMTEPYTALGYLFLGGGAEASNPSVLGNDDANTSKVDWVIIELRSAANPATIVTSRAALLCRNGSITNESGGTSVLLKAPPGSYFVAIRHRNHLGVMTATARTFSPGLGAVLDFTQTATAVYGTAARKNVSGVETLLAGDVTFNGELKYTGASNDRDPILVTVGSTTPNNTVNAYSTRDVNLDGTVKYTGSGNDRDPILVNVGSTTPNSTRLEQIP